MKETRVKTELRHLLEAVTSPNLPGVFQAGAAARLHEQALRLFEELHNDTRDPERQARRYREEFAENPEFVQLRQAFDTWCAIWFWPANRLATAPMPSNFSQPSAETLDEIARLRDQLHFFHWELEFPDVFTRTRSGFDAIIGNPPWEIQKPNSREFFSNIDPLYRTYGKQDAIQRQVAYFKMDVSKERDWLAYNAGLKAMGNWTQFAATPFGDEESGYSFTRSRDENAILNENWRKVRAGRAGYADGQHPFRYQGSADINTYKLFLEQAHHLLNPGGTLGLIVPSGLYTDKGCKDLRTLFLDHCQWRWLFSFENRDGIFMIHRSFKFCAVLVQKGGVSTQIRAAFMQRDLSHWEEAEAHVLDYPRERVEQFSPRSRSILEISSSRDLEILQKMYSNGVLLGDESEQGWGIKYACEFHMTNDSKLFPPRPKWEAEGYVPDEYGHWLLGKWTPDEGGGYEAGSVRSRDGKQRIKISEIEDVALPLYQGIMIGQFDFCKAGWVSGTGLQAKWNQLGWTEKKLNPQFLMALHHTSSNANNLNIGFRDIARTTDQRTMIAAAIRDLPCGNKVPVLTARSNEEGLVIVSTLNSFCFDYVDRTRQGSTSINYFVIAEAPILGPLILTKNSIRKYALGISLGGSCFAEIWVSCCSAKEGSGWKRQWAITENERLRVRCILDALVSHEYGFSTRDLAHILHDCDHPTEQVSNKAFSRTLDPKGFWRVDKEKHPELRHTVLAQVAFAELERMGLDAFLNQNNGEGWMLPETLRLADYGLGHDERAQHPQPVASVLGPRFLDWQLNEDVEASWEECRIHAENIRAIRTKFAPPPPASETAPLSTSSTPAKTRKSQRTKPTASPTDLLGHPLDLDLFGEER